MVLAASKTGFEVVRGKKMISFFKAILGLGRDGVVPDKPGPPPPMPRTGGIVRFNPDLEERCWWQCKKCGQLFDGGAYAIELHRCQCKERKREINANINGRR